MAPTPPTTEEHSLSAATPVSLGLVGAVGVVVLGLAGAMAVDHYKMDVHQKHDDAQDVRLDAGESARAEHEARLRVLESVLRGMDGKLDKLLEGGVRPAGGHGR